MAQEAKKAGKLGGGPFCAGRLDELSEWLCSRYDDYDNISDPRVLEYVTERVCLAPDDESFPQCDSHQVIEYLGALGERVISNVEKGSNVDRQYGRESRKVLQKLLDEMEQPKEEPVLWEADEFLRLLKADKPQSPDSLVKLPREGDLYVVGDLHGDAHITALLESYFERKIAPQSRIVFVGDYVNNGLKSIETLRTILDLRKRYPENVILLSGNHEVGETYATAFKEFFDTHWTQWLGFSARVSPGFKRPPGHYGHIRIDLARRYGVARGEAIHAAFAEWGRSLPFLAYSAKGILIAHSLGFDEDGEPTCDDFVNAKNDPDDVNGLEDYGYEAWKKQGKTLHSQMVGNRNITPGVLAGIKDAFQVKGLDVEVFAVGHVHYRSGDRDRIDQRELVTVCSSHPRSPDAGHYIAHEFESSRQEKFPTERRSGFAFPCVVRFTDQEREVTSIGEENVLHLFGLFNG
jgi:hypothetical protein